MRLSDPFHAVATGPRRRRWLLTPVGLTVFGGLLVLLVWGALYTDDALSLPPLLPGSSGLVVGISLLASGTWLWGWCVVLFRRGGGTPVPFNPPDELVVDGPYACVRNPMLTGVFTTLFGLGFLLHSWALVFLWTPAFVLFNALELRWVEEPELERRFGEAYRAYRRRVPMFFPRRPIVGGR